MGIKGDPLPAHFCPPRPGLVLVGALGKVELAGEHNDSTGLVIHGPLPKRPGLEVSMWGEGSS
jgi:hypothetical protein